MYGKIIHCILFFSINSLFYGMDLQQVDKAPTLLSLALAECLSHGSIDNVFSQLEQRGIYLSKKEFNTEIVNAIQRNPIKTIYDRLPVACQSLFLDKQNNFSEQILHLTMNIRLSDGWVMHTSEYYQQRAILEELIAKCALLKIDCSSSLHYGYSDYAITQLLLGCSAHPDIKDKTDKTPLYYAVLQYQSLLLGQLSRLRAINALLQHGACPDLDIITLANDKWYSFGSMKKIVPNEVLLLLVTYICPLAHKVIKIVFTLGAIGIVLVIDRIFPVVKAT